MQTTILCPHCKTEIELKDALIHQIEEKVLGDERRKHDEEVADYKKKLELAQNAELEIRKQKNQLDEERRTLKLEIQRQMDEERAKIREKTAEEVMESQRLKDKEKDKVIDDLKKALDDAQRKASQGSQQLQGEVQELDLESTLRNIMVTDLIEPVAKGVLGADIRQVVKTQRGNTCGTILWESKRTKAWSDGWIAKLKEDQLKDKANVAAIVSDVLPEEIKSGIGLKDGIWVCSTKLVVPLAMLLHKAIEDAARQKFISDRRQTDAERIYAVVTSHEFVQQVDSMMETYAQMLEQITKERNVFEKSWKARESQVRHLMLGVSGIVGQLQDAAGPALPVIKSLELHGEDEQS